MHIDIRPRGGPASRLFDVAASHDPADPVRWQYLNGLDEHDLRDLEYELARRRAMGKRCPHVHGRHACALVPGHDGDHACRGCDTCWFHLRALP